MRSPVAPPPPTSTGPLVRTLPANLVTGSTYTFPVGKGSFKMLELVNPTTNAGGTVTIEAEVFDARLRR